MSSWHCGDKISEGRTGRVAGKGAFGRHLSAWLYRCFICEVLGVDAGHELFDCRKLESQKARGWFIRNRSRIRYDRYTACYGCGLPQSMCDNRDTKKGCIYRGVLLAMVTMMLYGPWEKQIEAPWRYRLRRSSVDAENEEEVVNYLGKESKRCWLRVVCLRAPLSIGWRQSVSTTISPCDSCTTLSSPRGGGRGCREMSEKKKLVFDRYRTQNIWLFTRTIIRLM